ncbi:porin family protein [Panacibacter ginsenosidivorans]|uniref:Porin family protein n=1 Tax=Panacibacter ginsenosidivorans TaxID=1813871 RepID=A0A5B8VC39_9BACT|nr:outer membrane beta-barrel protein [Panacibacter ginsenosidivorans]QEC68892.1 porin family protein [Panacibacter ginsenosidivorans]
MQDVGEHMDELFRKAADNYMLKEGESNWNKIAGQLEPSVVAPVVPETKNKRTGKHIITANLLLLCFASGILFNKYALINKVIPVNTKHQTNNTSADKLNESILSPGEEKIQQDKVVINDQNKNTQPYLDHNRITTAANRPDKKDQLIYTPGIKYNIARIDDKNIPHIKNFPASDNKIDNEQVTLIQSPELLTVSNHKPVDAKQTLSNDSASNNPAIKLTVKNKHGMYYGLLAGAGFTTVKSQSFTKPGFDIGIAAGYQLSARSSVEINVLYTHKYYYSDGKYFSMDKMKNDMPQDMKIMSVKGNSSIIEIPLKFRYNIVQGTNNAVYASAGISSYILVNEKNNYTTSINGNTGNMHSNYTNTSGYFAGAFNISAGYAHSVGKNNTIRFEPYVTIPAKGIGIGSLPVSTSGVHVFFTIAPHK